MSERRPNLLSIAAGAAAIGVIGGIAAYFYFQVIPVRETGDAVASAKVIPAEDWIVSLLSSDPQTRAQLEKFRKSRVNNASSAQLPLRETYSVAGIPFSSELLSIGTPNPQQRESLLGTNPRQRQSLNTPNPRQRESFITTSPHQRESLGTSNPRQRQSLNTPKPRQTISQGMRPLTRSTQQQMQVRQSPGTPKPRPRISHGMQQFTRSTQRQIEECNV
ncbi:MAG: hypothetical protein KME17_09350 [Cyanosarcina radialis HA8281-LM2]|jgi:hypothetical protein|nr:hypothetical protein [Cyanosarcina radialis HA8281-LM2]